MKQAVKSITEQICTPSLKIATYVLAVMLASTAGAWDNPLSVEANQTYTLSGDETHDQLIVNEGSVIELNGHNLTITGAFSPSSTAENHAIVQNSANDEAAVMRFELTQGIGSSEFSKIEFRDNLTLAVNASFSDSTFVNGVNNTHTGGTILDNTRYGSNDEGKVPRIDNANGLGTGSVTFANGATLRAISAAFTYPWTAIASTGNGCTNQFYMEYANSLNAAGIPVTVEAGNIFCLRHLQRGIGSNWNEADYSGVLGTFWIRGNDADNATGHSNIGFYPDMPNGVLMLSGKELRHGGTGGDDHVWRLGGIATPDSITSYSSGAILRRTGTDGGKVTVEVGSANVDTTWYGEFTYDNNSNKDWNIKKVGTGVWTIGGANTYRGTTEIAEGAIRLLKTGEIGSSESNPTIKFTGGTLIFAAVPDHNPLSRFAAETAPLKIGVEKDVEISGELSGNVQAEAGIVKSGEGDLLFTNFHSLPSPAIVSNGLMFAKVNASFSGRIEVVNEDATLALYASGKELSVQVTNEDSSNTRTGATIHGAGTLRLDTEAGKDWGWRLMNADFSDFTGTLEVTAINENNSGTAHGITGRWDGWNNHFENTTLKISGAPAEDRIVFFEERNSLTLGAIQLLNAHAQFKITGENDLLTFGGKANSESIFNGQFVANKVQLVKNGDTPLTLGSGFSVVDGSTLTVNAGTLVNNADLSGELNYTLTIDPGVRFTGEGVFGAVDLYVNDVVVPDASTFTDKTAEYGFLTATSFSNIGSSSNISSLLATLNANETRGKWKVVARSNGDGTVTLKCVYSKNAFVVILR